MSSPMQQHGSKYFSPGPLPPQGMGSKVQNLFFQNIVMLNIKLKGIKYAATSNQIFCPQHPLSPSSFPRSWVWG